MNWYNRTIKTVTLDTSLTTIRYTDMSEIYPVAYNSQNAAKLVTTDTANMLASNNLKLSIRQSYKSIDPRDLRECSFLGVDMVISDRETYTTYQDFLEKHFDMSQEDINDYYYLAVERLADGKMVTVDELTPWSVDKRVGVIYISKTDVRNSMMFKRGIPGFEAQNAQSANDRAIAIMENEVTRCSIYMQNSVHDVMVSTLDDTHSHTETFIYALPEAHENKSNDIVIAKGSRIDNAVTKAINIVLSKLTD